jgi:hypothetical protein
VKLSELIQQLEGIQALLDEGGIDPDVFVSYQPHYPLYADIQGIVSSADVYQHAPTVFTDGEDAVDTAFCDDEGRTIHILLAQGDKGYSTKALWRTLEAM